jgi:hypothetical protein
MQMPDTEDEGEFLELEETLEATTALIESMLKEVISLETRLATMKRPLQAMHVDQLGDLDFLKGSSFRQTEFKFAKHDVAVLAGLDPKKRHTFQKISECLRKAIIGQKLVNEEGTITLTKPIQKMFETKETTITFPGLLGCLRQVLV